MGGERSGEGLDVLFFAGEMREEHGYKQDWNTDDADDADSRGFRNDCKFVTSQVVLVVTGDLHCLRCQR